jgi:DNA-directed RNA polymerase specialized sigma24 family protein
LRGERDVFFRKDSAPSKKRIQKSAPKTPERAFLEEEPQALFEKLRKLRLDISKYLGFPPYIVFQDKALKEMTLLKPSNVKEFLRINGVGETKAQKYAEIFMACIRGEDTDIAAYIERKGDAGDADAKDENSADESGAKKQQIIELLKDGNLSSAEIAGTVGVSPPTVWAYKAHVTMGKYDTSHEKAPDGEDLTTDWKPDPEVVLFIRGKIQALGSLEAVNAHYKDDSQICEYARRMAPLILSEAEKDAKDLNPYVKKARQKHPEAYAPWTEDDDRKLEQSCRSGVSILELANLFGRTRGAIKSRIKKLNLKCRQEYAPVEPDPKDPFQKSMVCFAVSRKYKGYCVAGKKWSNDPESPWFRPVSASAMGELPLKTIQLEDGKKPAFLDIVTIAIKKPLPHYYQAENCLVDGGRRWEKKGRLKPEELVDYCDHVDTLWENGHHSVHGMNDRIPIEVANERCESSLVLIEPRDFCLVLATAPVVEAAGSGFVYIIGTDDGSGIRRSRTEDCPCK